MALVVAIMLMSSQGLVEGVGSFAAIRDHIKTSAHRRARNERISRQVRR
jgi:hypothetical protein